MTTLEKAIEVYGKDMQLTVAVEEFSELTKELCKHKRGANNIDNIVEEMADCYIMLEQLKIIFGLNNLDIDVIQYAMKKKLDRLEKRLAERSE